MRSDPPDLSLVADTDLRRAVYRLRASVFGRELRVLEDSAPDELSDAWDATAHIVAACRAGEVIGTGRLIHRPGSLGFRASSSVDLRELLGDELERTAEMSGLAVAKDSRGCGVGHAIHYLRLLLAHGLGATTVIASCYEETAVHLVDMGFEVVVDRFEYRHYATGRRSSRLLAFDCGKPAHLLRVGRHLERRFGEALRRQVEHCYGCARPSALQG